MARFLILPDILRLRNSSNGSNAPVTPDAYHFIDNLEGSEFMTFALKDFESSLIYCTSGAFQSVPPTNAEGHGSCVHDGPFFAKRNEV